MVTDPYLVETMIPEGLEFASAEEILENVAGVGFNFVRMYVIHQGGLSPITWVISTFDV